MKLKLPFQNGTFGSMLYSIGIAIGSILLLSIIYFYIYLPHITHHGASITVPDLEGQNLAEVEELLGRKDLRFSVSDSGYSESQPPLVVLKQFPRSGAYVKEGRMIYISINRVAPPTLPLPDVTESSLTNADLIFKSNELKRGRVYYKPDPFMNVVIEMRYLGKKIEPNTRVPKGAVIDLVVGDGQGNSDFILETLVGDTYDRALFKLGGWNLHLGNVEIPADADTTGTEIIVFKQRPAAGDSIKVGAPVDLWIAPQGYKPATE